MKKTIFTITLLLFISNQIFSQCTQFAGGPYSDQGIDLAGCTGESVAAPYSAWQNEVYFSVVQALGNYTFELVGCNATAWGGTVEITAIDGGTQSGSTIVGGTNTVATGCSVTFTATVSDTTWFVVTTVGGCGTALLQTDNGVPTITTNSGVLCGTCGANGCEATENYCDCPADCDCAGTNPVWVSGYDTGNFAISADAVAYCEDEVNTGGANPSPDIVYVPFAPLGNQPCVTSWDVTADFGSLWNSTDPISAMTAPLDDGFIGLLGLTDADIAASTGTVTITFVDATTANGCTFDLVLDVSLLLNAAGTAWAGSAALACPALCTPPSGTFVSYDCAGPSAIIDITDLGSPTAGSTGFTGEIRDENGTVITSGIVLSIGNVTFPLPDNNQIYDIVFTDGLTTGCDVGFFNNILMYGNCRQGDGPAADCIFVMDENSLDGDFEEVPSLWTLNNTGIISPSFPLDNTNGIFMGGFGVANADTASQVIAIPAGSTSATMHYWIWFGGCADATDIFTIDVDGTTIQTFNGADVRCGGNWVEEMVDLTAYADGAAHELEITLLETGSGLGDGFTAILIDDIIIESCGVACPPNLVLTTSETGDQTYVAGATINSDDVIEDGETVSYQAPIITLEGGFEVEPNAVFMALLGGCLTLQNEQADAVAQSNSSTKKSTYISKNTPISLQADKEVFLKKNNTNVNHSLKVNSRLLK